MLKKWVPAGRSNLGVKRVEFLGENFPRTYFDVKTSSIPIKEAFGEKSGWSDHYYYTTPSKRYRYKGVPTVYHVALHGVTSPGADGGS